MADEQPARVVGRHSRRGLSLAGRRCSRIKLATLLCFAAATGDAQSFRPDDLLGLTQVNAATVARGGEAIAVSLTRPSAMTDERTDELHVIVRTSNGDLTHVLRDAGFPMWSTDGRRLQFISGQDGVIELRELDRGAGTLTTRARLPHGPERLTWSPSQRRIAFIANVPIAPRSRFTLPADPASAQRPVIIEHAVFRQEDGSRLPATEPTLFVLEIATGESRTIPLPEGTSLTQTEAGSGGAPAWSADESSLIVSVARGFDSSSSLWNVNRDLLKVSVKSGTPQWLAESSGLESDPAVSANGRHLAYLRQRGAPEATVFHRDLVVRDLQSRREVLVWSERDLDIESLSWTADGSALVVRYLDRGRFVLSQVSLAGKAARLSDEAVAAAPPMPSPGGLLAFVRSRADLPPEAAVLDKSGRVESWTSFNAEARARELSQVSEIEYRSANADARMIHALLARPRNAADLSKLPVVVDLHGGPYSARTFNFDATREFFVSQGFVVIQPNYRGSWGYGAGFAQLSDRKHYPGWFDAPESATDMGLDVAGVLNAVAEQKLGDPRRVFLRGVSAGALLTTWTIGRTGGFVAAAANSWYPGEWSAPNYGSYQIRRYFTGPPWDPKHQGEYWRRQPIMLADRITTPLLILQGETDWNTPLMEAEKFYYALRSRGADVTLAVFPDETHGLRRHPASSRNSLLMEVQWFLQHESPSPGERPK